MSLVPSKEERAAGRAFAERVNGEEQAIRYGAECARREIMEYLRSVGQAGWAMAIEQRCKWPEKGA